MYLKIIFLLVLAGCGDHVDSPSVPDGGEIFPIGNTTINRISDISTASVPSISAKQHDDHYTGPDLEEIGTDDHHQSEQEKEEHSDRSHDDDDDDDDDDDH